MPADENFTSGGEGSYRLRRYHVNGSLTLDQPARTTCSSSQLTVTTRTRGKRLPLLEKPYTRTHVAVNIPTGDIGHWSRTSGGQNYYERHTGSQSQVTGGLRDWDWGQLMSVNSSEGNAFKTRYACSPASLGINIDLLSQAEVKAFAKLRGKSGSPDTNFGLMWAERRETAQLLQSAVTGMAELVRACGRKDWRKSAAVLKGMFLDTTASPRREKARMEWVERKLRRELKRAPKSAERAISSVENAILGYNLGIKPLISDVWSAVDALQAGDLMTGFDIKVKARHSRVINDACSGKLSHGRSISSSGLDDGSFEATAAETHGYTVTLVARPRFTSDALVSRLGLSDLSTPYNAVKLTWLVDYWWNLSKVLEALNVPREFEFVSGSYTQRLIRNCTVKMTSSLHDTSVAVGRGVVNHTKRTVYQKFPFPIPPLSDRMRDLSVTQSLNVTALSSRFLRDVLHGIF